MSKSRYVTGLRAVEQLLASDGTEVRRVYAEYRSANPRVEAVLVRARESGIDIQSANRARLQQISGKLDTRESWQRCNAQRYLMRPASDQ